MKRTHQNIALTAQHRPPFKLCQHLHRRASLGHHGRADENGRKSRLADSCDFQVHFKRGGLATVGVALYRYVYGSISNLVVATAAQLASQQDHSRAGSPDGHPFADSLGQRLAQIVGFQHHRDCRGFAARHYQAMDLAQIARLAHLPVRHARGSKHLLMQTDIALQPQNACDEVLAVRRVWRAACRSARWLVVAGYHPLLAKRVSKVAISSPGIGSPRLRLTFNKICGSMKLVVASTMASARF